MLYRLSYARERLYCTIAWLAPQVAPKTHPGLEQSQSRPAANTILAKINREGNLALHRREIGRAA